MKRGGFSLIELIVVMALIGLMSVIALPFIAGTIDRLSAKTTLKEIAASLRKARSIAVSQKKTYIFDLDISRPGYSVHSEVTEFSLDNDKPPVFLIKKDINRRVEITGVLLPATEEVQRSGVASIAFYPRGSSSGGTIFIKAKDEEIENAIVVDKISGRIKIKMGKE